MGDRSQRVKGKAEEVKGRAKRETGITTGRPGTEARGAGEALATSYLPLLDLLGRAPITLSLTPVLCDQLEAPGAIDRCLAFLTEIRPESHRLDIEAFRRAGDFAAAEELERSAAEYAAAA